VSGHENERLSAYLDGELPPAEMAAVAAHVAACHECALRLAELGAVDQAASGSAAAAPDGYFEALPGKVRARLAPPARRLRLPAWTWAAVAAVLVASVAPLVLSRRTTAPIEEPSAPERSGALPAAPPGNVTEAPPADAGPKAQAPRKALADKNTPARPVGGAAAKSERGFVRPPEAASAPTPMAAAAVEPRALEARPDERSDEEAVAQTAPGAPAATLREQPRDVRAEPGSAERKAVAGTPAHAAPAAAQESVRGPAQGETLAPSAPAGLEVQWRRLQAEEPQTASAWRRLREGLRAFAATAPDGPHADEARVQMIEAGYHAWRAGSDPQDEAVFRRDAAAYLARADARQKARVERRLEDAARPGVP
jgi:hypothetical protein